MEAIFETININNVNGIINLYHEKGKEFDSSYDEKSLKARKGLESLFNAMSNNNIKSILRKKEENKISILFETQKGLIKTIINDYNVIKKKAYFKNLQNNIRKYNTEVLANKVSQKVDLQKIVCAGSLISSMVLVTVINNLPDETLQAMSPHHTTSSTTSISETFNNDVEIIDDIDDINDISKQVFTLNIQDNPEISFHSNDKIDTENKQDDSEPKVIEEQIIYESENLENNIDSNQFFEIEETVTNKNNSNTYFSELKNCGNYDDYIKFAAKLYYVDYESAKKAVEENFTTFTTPSENVSGDVTTEMNRMKDLKEKGIINGDLNIIGIFITIKDYAIDNLNLNNQTPIISNKTNEEQEQTLIDVAKYIYGIDNTDILNTIIAIHRVETGSGTDLIATEKNNLGGIINPNSDYDKPYPNVYKTNEIGAESAIRNFLMVFDKCIYEPNNKQATTIPEFMCNTYCPHTPENWKTKVTGKINEGIPEIVEEYLNNTTTKTY